MLQPEDDAAWQLLAASGNERPRVMLQRRIFMLLMLMLLPVADQTALPIRRPRTKQLRGGQGEKPYISRRSRKATRVDSSFPSVGNGEPIGRVA